MMAADSAGGTVTTVVTCEGDLASATFRAEFDVVLGQLEGLLGEPLTVRKLEPWNSVRVTLSIPREAALRLRQLANDGNHRLRALGILSVQVEGDQVISLRLAATGSGGTAEPQEVVLRTTTAQDAVAVAAPAACNLSQLLSGGVGGGSSSSSAVSSSSDAQLATSTAVVHDKVQFRSPNVVCPADSIVPKVPTHGVPNNAACGMLQTSAKTGSPYVGPFPFTSMNQAITASPTSTSNYAPATQPTAPPPPPPPPPYPGKHPPVTLSSPLLVNLLQNEGTSSSVEQRPLQKIATVRVNNNNSTCTTTIASSSSNNNNNAVPFKQHQQRPLPAKPIARNPVPYNSYPPPYPNAADSAPRWEQPAAQQMPQLQDLTATLTDFKQTDLDLLLPHVTASPLDIADELLNAENRTVLLINPLTGELEPQVGADSDEEVRDVFTGLPLSPVHFSDEDTNSTIRPDTTDQSDSESRSYNSDSSKPSKVKTRTRDKGRDSPSGGKQQQQQPPPPEKIKLRLKLEKSEPVSAVYKADVSFINAQQPKKALTNNVPGAAVPGEEPRVPPLHISLRGRHVVISNKRKSKTNSVDGVIGGAPVKAVKPKKLLEYNSKLKRERNALESVTSDDRKLKVTKMGADGEGVELVYNNHIQLHKDKLKERRGSDSELMRAKKYLENGERRLSQSDDGFDPEIVLGSTNVGTVTAIGKNRNKDKFRLKDNFKIKDLARFKSYTLGINDKVGKQQQQQQQQQTQIALPTNEIDMEARFKERLLKIEDGGTCAASPGAKVDELIQTLAEQPTSVKEKPPEADKCNTPERGKDLQDKQSVSRSPNSGAQGEDSGIESMDALSEKSPNQASQSPHAEIIVDAHKTHKTQVPDILDIEAQLAKMEGIHADEVVTGEPEPEDDDDDDDADQLDDLNENRRGAAKLEQCCARSSLAASGGDASTDVTKAAAPKESDEVGRRVPVASMYTSFAKEKRDADSPTLDADHHENSGLATNPVVRKSLLEQLLIDIPDTHAPSSPSPATRSVRTRAASKLNSPELHSPVTVAALATNATNNNNNKTMTRSTPMAKRKRHESDSSSNSLESEQRTKKPRKGSAELADAAAAAAMQIKEVASKKKIMEESSDSDEPLIEVAGKVRKSTAIATPRVVKLKNSALSGVAAASTRRSIRTATPTVNTRSKGDKSNPESDVVRRKTRSAVSEGEGKRRKDIK